MPTADCCATHEPLLTLALALERAAQAIEPISEVEEVALAECAGRVLAADITAPYAAPAADLSAMDGFALYLHDLSAHSATKLPVVGAALAGHPYLEPLPAQSALRITTGAWLPPGAEAVIMQEDCTVSADGTWIEISAAAAARLTAGANVRRRGEDMQAGNVLLTKGLRLRPQDLGLAASQGIQQLPVVRRLRVALASTGDELSAAGATLALGAIYDANRPLLLSLLQRLGCAVSDLGIVRDDTATLLPSLRAAAATHDVLITSGGVSVGTADLVKDAIASLGDIAFWRLAIKPGKPVAFGSIGNCLALGLPGNPVSVMITFLMFARPLLLRCMGAKYAPPAKLRVTAAGDFRRKAGRREWLRARLIMDSEQRLLAEIYPHNSSAALASLTWADGLVELAEDCAAVDAGEYVDYLPFSALGVD